MKNFIAGVAVSLGVLTPAVAGTSVKICGSTPWSATNAAIAYGISLGFFAEEGLDPELVAVQGGAIVLPQIANKKIEFGVVNPDLAIMALAKGEAYPIRFVYNLYTTQIFEFAVLASSPIKTLADLKGKKVGVGALSWSNLPMSKAMLKDVGLTWQENVQVLPVGVGPAAWSRLKTGSVDALNLFGHQHEAMALSGTPIRRLPLPEKFRPLFSNGIIVHEDTIKENPALVEKVGRAIAKSTYACSLNYEACAKGFWTIEPSSRPTPDKEAAWVAQYAALNKVDINFIQGAQAKGHSGEYGAAQWRDIIRIMKDAEQITTSDLPVEKLFTNQFVRAFNAWDRAAVQKKVVDTSGSR